MESTDAAKKALMQYHFAERLKLDVMMIAHQYMTITSLKKEEKPGAKRILINITEVLASDAKAAGGITGSAEFEKAAEVLYEVSELAEENKFGLASEKAGEALTPITTAAVVAWEVLDSHGLI